MLDLLSDIPTLTQEQKDSIIPRLDITGLPPVQLPDNGEQLVFPADLVSLDASSVSRTYSEYMTWLGYLKAHIGFLDAKVSAVKFCINALTSQIEKNNPSLKSAALKKLILGDDGVIALQGYLAELQYQQRVYEGQSEYYENCAKSLSRELSRRIAEKESKYSYPGITD
jgi:hypothetical protein